MIRVLLDTNIVLDVLLDRQPWNSQAKAIWQAHLDNQIAAHVTATTITNVFYVARRHTSRAQAWRAIHACLDQLYLIAVGAAELGPQQLWVGVTSKIVCKFRVPWLQI